MRVPDAAPSTYPLPPMPTSGSTSLLAVVLLLLGLGCTSNRSAETTPDALPLIGITWQLMAFGEAAPQQPDLADGDITIAFSDTNRVAGTAACNRYTGGYDVAGAALTLTPQAATRRMCPPAVMAREQAYLDALDAVRGWARTDAQLFLTNADGAPLLRFAAAGVDPARVTEDSPGTVDFRAVGQEPGWTLELTEGGRIDFRYAYGERSAVAPTPAPERTNGRTVYRATTEAHDLTVTIADEPCTDIMSGERFEATVTIALDGSTYRGCGRALR